MALATAVVVVIGPQGLTLRGRTSKLVWTRRLKTTTAVAGALYLLLALVAVGAGSVAAAVAASGALGLPVVIDAALGLCAPFERRAAGRYVLTASARLRATSPTTVAITGSYGKTTTKQYVRHLVSSQRSVLASPASFNNTGGLSRTLNEHLTPGTEVFVAEMGMYGPGEIRSMCAWVKPDIGVIVNIGPVHLERVGSLDGIVQAKAEITEGVSTSVLNVDAHGLAALADRLAAKGQRVIRVATSTATRADVAVVARPDGSLRVLVQGAEVASVPAHRAQPSNVAAALGVVLALDLDLTPVLPLLQSLPQAEHRMEVTTSANGVTVVDNTFSSNPASAASSLALVDALAGNDARVAVVTPGMVELGDRQAEENTAFAAAIDDVATDLLIVGFTNRRALLAGANHRSVTIHLAANRQVAVDWVKENLRAGDAVLYENDLPDHYP